MSDRLRAADRRAQGTANPSNTDSEGSAMMLEEDDRPYENNSDEEHEGNSSQGQQQTGPTRDEETTNSHDTIKEMGKEKQCGNEEGMKQAEDFLTEDEKE